ncbi:MAG: thioesterase family protein [Chloroflexota bacterium]
MPATHIESFRVRSYECNAFGYFTLVNCLRWMQEAAFAASAAVGFDFARYDQFGHLWLIRETRVEYLAPLQFNNEVEIKTWVVDFQRFRSLRAYEVRHSQSGALAASGQTDWIYLNSATLRPVTIPLEMRQAFFPEGAPGESDRRGRYPAAPAAPAGVFRLRRQVGWSAIDRMWHVNNARYLEYLDDAEKQACARYGWPIERLRAAGVDLQTREFRIEYRQPAGLGDELEIATWFSDVQNETGLRHYEIRRASDGTLLVQARARWGFMNVQTAQPVPIPGDFLQALHDNRSASG